MNTAEAASPIRIDVSSIPPEVQSRLAAGTLEFIRELLKDPVSRAALEARVAADRMAKE